MHLVYGYWGSDTGAHTNCRVFAKEIKQDTTMLLHDTTELKLDTEDILAEISRLRRAIMSGPARDRDSEYILHRYLDELTSFSGSVCGDATISKPRSVEPSSRRHD